MEDKKEKTLVLLKKIKNISAKAIESGNYEKALAAIAFMGGYLYYYNQFYTEDDLERYLCIISDKLKEKFGINTDFATTENIIFYDGFGGDTRGVALNYLNGLGLDNYHVIYITNKVQENNLPTVEKMCNKYHFEMRYIEMDKYCTWAKQLSDLFVEYKPKAAFYYTSPNDASGIAAFHMFDGVVDRYLIDLTDHAFWLGKSAVDYFLASRRMSASLQYYQRGIEKSRMLKIGVNMLMEDVTDHSGLPFDPENTDYIFSGGVLYKTLGDPENTYYRIIDHILSCHNSVKFLYAGGGDDSELKKIIERYPGRAFHSEERKDFYYLIQNCALYLNTYPMFGGLMMKYCGLAQKLPITLKHMNDSDDLLLNQDQCKIEYSSYEELISDVDRLLSDPEYRKSREKLLDGSVYTQERFCNNLRSVIENHKSYDEHTYSEIDTSAFRKEFYDRFNYDEEILRLARMVNIGLFMDFPSVFIKGFALKAIEKIKGNPTE